MARPSKARAALVRVRGAMQPQETSEDPRESREPDGEVSEGGAPVALDIPEVTALTERFHELRRQGARTIVDLSIELGAILEEGRKVLAGSFHRWLRERIGIEPQTARNYLALARMARESPGVIERWKELGASKLYRVARLPRDGQRAVLRAPRLAEMTDREFKDVTAPFLVQERKVTGNMRAHGLRMKLQSFRRDLAAARISGIQDDTIRDGLREDLESLGRTVETLLGRLDKR